MVEKEMIKLCVPDINEDDQKLVNEVLASGWLAHGPYNKKFEKSFAEYVGTDYAVSLNSCTSALELSIQANEIKGEVILPSFTWNASANSVMTSGAKPVFVDIDYDTCNINPDEVEKALTKDTEAIMPVHYAGQACDMDRILEIAGENDLYIIEDSAETIGGTWKDKKTGSFGTGCFSFFPTKNFTTGEGGMVTTNNESLARKIKALSAHGVETHTHERQGKEYAWYRESTYFGYNYRMSNILAALGFSQLSRLDDMNSRRTNIAKIYSDFFSEIPNLDIPFEEQKAKHVYQMYTLKFPLLSRSKRDNLVNNIRKKGVEASVHFVPPVHRQPAYCDKYGSLDLPVTNRISDTIVTLPMYPQMSASDIGKVCDVVQESYKKII